MNKRVLPNKLMLDGVSELVAEGKEVWIPTKGISMLPFIVGGRDSVLLVLAQSLKRGDIALADLDGSGHYVLHRVTGIDNGIVRLKGDGNLDSAESCPQAAVKARVKEIRSEKGRVRNPSSAGWQRLWRCWTALPRPARRVLLKVFKIIKHIK
ncbi:MAG: S24/S26 family peptidase [Bacteroidales bacterium]|nr:S24/S26 family peptidase [Bacteroidales bacterium]